MSPAVIDGHNDLPWRMRTLCGYDLSAVDLVGGDTRVHTDLVAVTATSEQIGFVHRLVDAFPEVLGLATSADGVEKVMADGRIASLMGMEGGHSINESLPTLRMMNRIGMFVDLSQVSADVMRAALDTTTAPVIFSHSSARAVTDHPGTSPTRCSAASRTTVACAW